MAPNSSWKPYSSLTEAPTNLKEAIDWVLRVTGRDGKALNKETECICGLAAAVTDLLQSVQLEYHGYQGEATGKGPQKERVTECLNGLFSLVQGLGGAAVVRTYIDQLAQVLSALVGWSKIDKCSGSGECKVGAHGYQHGKNGCKYLNEVTPNDPCTECKCMKWEVKSPDNEGTPLGRKCTRCSDSGGNAHRCQCTGVTCEGPGKECQCAKAGKCCKCCCKDECGCKKECICSKDKFGHDEYNKDSYMSAYPSGTVYTRDSFVESKQVDVKPYWKDVTSSTNRHQCARILLGSVCLIWSGLTYMYWTGKYHKSSPRWNNHILDGSGLDDGTLSQWLQALGFPKEMLNNHGPGNRLDAVIWDGFRGMLYLGFPDTSDWKDIRVHGNDQHDNTFRQPAGMNYAGYIHTVDRGAFCSNATVFHKNANGATITDEQMHKCGALYKLYILSCAYFTGLQKSSPPQAENRIPRTIREILYWLSALPYSQAYPKILKHSIERLKSVAPVVGDRKQLSFYQTGRTAPITVHEFNLFAHFQAVTQYCPLVLIGIQGGIHSPKGTNSTTPAIHSLYANTECHFTYPTVSIQAYNQVVHYIRALFYQLYFLRKQCAMKVALGGKWRECRYGKDVVSKGVISWMCLGCDPMEHDRKWRVENMGKKLDALLNKVKALEVDKEFGEEIIEVLKAIGNVVVQLGNAQEALEGKDKEAIEGVIKTLGKAKEKLVAANTGLDVKLGEAKTALEALTGKGSGSIESVTGGEGLGKATSDKKEFDPGKNRISEAIDGIHKVLEALKKAAKKEVEDIQKRHSHDLIIAIIELKEFLKIIDDVLDIVGSTRCVQCQSHSTKCGQPSNTTVCPTCLQPTTTGVPSPLQAFLEDRLPGFSCQEILYTEDADKYPSAASHLGHCNGSGQCCPLPMGFRGQFYSGSTSDSTGARLYGILYFFSNGDMMQSCVYTLVRVTAALSATTPQVLGDVFGFFRGGVGEKESGKTPKGTGDTQCQHEGDPSGSYDENKDKYFCGWCASGLREEVKKIGWIPKKDGDGGHYMATVGKALRDIKGEKGTGITPFSSAGTIPSNLSTLTDGNHYVSPLTGELYTAVSATFGGTYLSWVLYLSDALHSGLESLASEFQQIECRGCKGQCDPNKCKKGSHGSTAGDTKSTPLCQCQSIVSCTGVLPVLYRHGFSYGNPFNLEGYEQKGKESGDYSIENTKTTKRCHQFLDSLSAVINKKEDASQQNQDTTHPLTELLTQVGQLQYDIRLPWIFVLAVAWLVAVLYLAFGAILPLDWTHMRSHWLRGGAHQWQCMWYKVMTGRKGMELVEYFGRQRVAT